jgi:hypothetical protein
MGALVIELQELAQSNTPLPELMRRAKTVAVKLDRKDAHAWIEHEISGYPAGAELPPYRALSCSLRARDKYHPWEPLRFASADEITRGAEGELAKTIAAVPARFASWEFRDPISHIQSAADGDGAAFVHASQEEMDVLVLFFGEDLRRWQVARFFDRAGFRNILDCVRDKVLTWALELEQNGVLGHGMTFQPQEKRQAAQVVFNVNSVGAIVHGDNANIPTIQGSPGASIAIASTVDSPGSKTRASARSIRDRIEDASERLRAQDNDLAQVAEAFATSIWSDTSLIDEQKQEAMEALMCLLDEAGKDAKNRQAKGVLKSLTAGLRETFATHSEIAPLATSFCTQISKMLSIS